MNNLTQDAILTSLQRWKGNLLLINKEDLLSKLYIKDIDGLWVCVRNVDIETNLALPISKEKFEDESFIDIVRECIINLDLIYKLLGDTSLVREVHKSYVARLETTYLPLYYSTQLYCLKKDIPNTLQGMIESLDNWFEEIDELESLILKLKEEEQFHIEEHDRANRLRFIRSILKHLKNK